MSGYIWSTQIKKNGCILDFHLPENINNLLYYTSCSEYSKTIKSCIYQASEKRFIEEEYEIYNIKIVFNTEVIKQFNNNENNIFTAQLVELQKNRMDYFTHPALLDIKIASTKQDIFAWYVLPLDSDYIYNLKKKALLPLTSISKTIRGGGVVYTDNRRYTTEKIIAVYPDSKILYNCYLTDMPSITGTVLWIVNDLPLSYYVPDQDISTIYNYFKLWLPEDIDKISIYYYLLTNKLIYSRDKYRNSNEIISLEYSIFEGNMRKEYQNIHQEWLNGLQNIPDNKYSWTSIQKSKRYESRILPATIQLSMSIIPQKLVYSYFTDRKQFFDDLINETKEYSEEIKKIYSDIYIDKSPWASEPKLATCNEIINKNLNIFDVPKKIIRELIEEPLSECVYCCCEIGNVIGICGHRTCINCLIKILAESPRCGECKISWQLSSLAIIDDQPLSGVSGFISNLLETDLLLCNFNVIRCNNWKCSIINIVNVSDIKDILYYKWHRIYVLSTTSSSLVYNFARLLADEYTPIIELVINN
jgi:hypothetical protein